MNKNELIISRAEPKDYPELIEILNQGTERKLRYDDVSWGRSPWDARDIEYYGAEWFHIARTVGGVAVATLSLTWEGEKMWDSYPGLAAYVHRMVVKDEHKRQGIGAAMIAWAAKRAATEGRELVRLDCDVRNDSLCTRYRELGFQEVTHLTAPPDPSNDYIPALFQLSQAAVVERGGD